MYYLTALVCTTIIQYKKYVQKQKSMSTLQLLSFESISKNVGESRNNWEENREDIPIGQSGENPEVNPEQNL